MTDFAIIRFRFEGKESAHVMRTEQVKKIKEYIEVNDMHIKSLNCELYELLEDDYDNFIFDTLKVIAFRRLYDGDVHNSDANNDFLSNIISEIEEYISQSKKNSTNKSEPSFNDYIAPTTSIMSNTGNDTIFSKPLDRIVKKKFEVYKSNDYHNLYLSREHDLVFDPQSKKIVAKFKEGGGYPLTIEDEELCEENGMSYLSIEFPVFYCRKNISSQWEEKKEDYVSDVSDGSDIDQSDSDTEGLDDAKIDEYDPPTFIRTLDIFSKMYRFDGGLDKHSLQFLLNEEQLESIHYALTGEDKPELDVDQLLTHIECLFKRETTYKTVVLRCNGMRDYKLRTGEFLTYEDIMEGCRVFSKAGNRPEFNAIFLEKDCNVITLKVQ